MNKDKFTVDLIVSQVGTYIFGFSWALIFYNSHLPTPNILTNVLLYGITALSGLILLTLGTKEIFKDIKNENL